MRQAARVLAVALVGVLAGCVDTGTATGAATASATASPRGTGSGTTSSGTTSSGTDAASGCGAGMQITVKGSTVTPPPGTTNLEAGCQVELRITADRPSEVHVHVVDIERPITAGQPLRITFTPRQPGVYEVELHDPDLLLAKLAVR